MKEKDVKADLNFKGVNRRDVLKSAGALAIGASAVGASFGALAQGQQVQLVFSTFVDPKNDIYRNILSVWMDRIEKDSSGRIKFIRQSGAGSAQNLYKQVLEGQSEKGKLDIVWAPLGADVGRIKLFDAFELPFMTKDSSAASRALYEFMVETNIGNFEGVRPLVLHTGSYGVVHSKTKIVQQLSDMASMRVGATTSGAPIVRSFGSNVQVIAANKMSDALKNNAVDAVVLSWDEFEQNQLQEYAPYHSEFSVDAGSLYTNAYGLMMNESAYNSLPNDLKKIINEHSGIMSSGWFGALYESLSIAPRDRISKLPKHELNTIPLVQAQDFVRRTRGIESDWMRKLAGYNDRRIKADQVLARAREMIDKHSKAEAVIVPMIEKKYGKIPRLERS